MNESLSAPRCAQCVPSIATFSRHQFSATMHVITKSTGIFSGLFLVLCKSGLVAMITCMMTSHWLEVNTSEHRITQRY